MFKLPIDENSCIIQPYFDGGESYTGHHKYSLVTRYKSKPEGIIRQAWDSIMISVPAENKCEIESDNLDVDISDFTRFRLFARVNKNVRVKIFCNDELVLDEYGSGKIEITDSSVITTQKIIKNIRYEFYNESGSNEEIAIYYLGMINDKSKNKNPFTADWEGFFADVPSYDLFDENFISKEELITLRKKIKEEPYKSTYEGRKKIVQEIMKTEPEKQIKRTVSDYFRQPDNISGLVELAVIGQLDEDKDMLNMACRCALSLACCEYWCGDPMETVSGVTWHHRSFTESEIAREISTVISLAGGLLSWHGRNFLQNMLIMKALPRMEADFMTMEYIYHTNQGIGFMSGYVQALAVLADKYPRYERRIDEAEQMLDEMLQNAFSADGSTFEGANYWQYIMINYLYSVYFLAKHKKKNLKEYIGNKLDKVADFGLSMLDEGGYMIPVNDCGRGIYSMIIPAMLYEITGDKRWAKLYWQKHNADYMLSMVIVNSVDVPKCEVPIPNEFFYIPSVGYTQVYREGVHFFGVSGPSNSTHCHHDKGSFLIFKDGREIITDKALPYHEADSERLRTTPSHSIAIPEENGKIMEQLYGDGIKSVVKKAEYKNGIFEWECDNKEVWDDAFVKENTRKIVSEKPNEFIITDTFELKKEMSISFRINIADKSAVKVEPVDWKPTAEKYSVLYSNDKETIYQLILTSEKKLTHTLITKVTII